jgi:hypothetical protein
MSAAPPSGVKKRTGIWIVLGVLVVLLLPIVLATLLFPLLQEQPFESPEDIRPEKIESLRVFLLNRRELDGGEDVGPYFAAESDYATLLAPLQDVPSVADFPDARGPWLGEYRIVTRDGRKGTIRFYWTKPLQLPEVRPVRFSVGELDLEVFPALTWPHRLRFQIGEHKFEGGETATLIRAAELCAQRGQPDD